MNQLKTTSQSYHPKKSIPQFWQNCSPLCPPTLWRESTATFRRHLSSQGADLSAIFDDPDEHGNATLADSILRLHASHIQHPGEMANLRHQPTYDSALSSMPGRLTEYSRDLQKYLKEKLYPFEKEHGFLPIPSLVPFHSYKMSCTT